MADALIQRSIRTTSIVTVDYDEELACELAQRCEDSVETSEVSEYWGEDWRVHLRH